MEHLSDLRGVSMWICAAVICSIGACQPSLVYESEKQLPGYWSYADSAAFSYEIVDTAAAYDLTLTIAHTDIYATQNLYAKFVTHYPNGTAQAEAVSLELADKYGRWLGDCNGEQCQLKLPLQQGAKFPESGLYGLTLHQYGRTDSLPGISGLSFQVAIVD